MFNNEKKIAASFKRVKQDYNALNQTVRLMSEEIKVLKEENKQLKKQIDFISATPQSMSEDDMPVEEPQFIEMPKEDPVKNKTEMKDIKNKLLPAEIKVLEKLTESYMGKTPYEIAKDLNNSPRTIKTHIRNMKAKGIPIKFRVSFNGQKGYYLDDATLDLAVKTPNNNI